MFDRLYTQPRARTRHRDGPMARQRLDFLTYLAGRGYSPASLRSTAACLLQIAQRLKLAKRPGEVVSRAEVQRHTLRWSRRRFSHPGRRTGLYSRLAFHTCAVQWLRFLGRLQVPPAPTGPTATAVGDFIAHLQEGRGLSIVTVRAYGWTARRFLDRLTAGRSFRQVTASRIDDVFQSLVGDGRYARTSIRSWAGALRAFFRYAETRGWCRAGLAQAIESPRVFSRTTVPAGPSWEDVRRLIATADGDRPTDIRDRAILLLLAVYGLRAGEVRGLLLDDFDWEREVLTVACPKVQRTRTYPPGNRHLIQARPQTWWVTGVQFGSFSFPSLVGKSPQVVMDATFLQSLLPDDAGVRITDVAIDPAVVEVQPATTADVASCPRCRSLSATVHNWYRRTLRDRPCLGAPVRLLVTVRKFVCGRPVCPRRVFRERRPAFTDPHARTTGELADTQRDIGLALGGEAGARLAAKLGPPTRADTLLRRVKEAPDEPTPRPRYVGVDDWATRKGQSYGTILIDLERGDRDRPAARPRRRGVDGVADGQPASGSDHPRPLAGVNPGRDHRLLQQRETVAK